MFGFLNINKPPGPTSHDIVAQVRRKIGRKVKVGHTGTLDPFASGVLVVAVGPAVRLAGYVQAAPKRYTAEVTLAATSTTDDAAGDITLTPDPAKPTGRQMRQALVQLTGTIMQRPPAYSAVHVDGKRAYKLARSGRKVAPLARSVTIHQLELLRYEYPKVELDVLCGAGTYIRSLARDLGEVLGVGGYCSALVRTAVGQFTADQAVSFEDLNVTEDLIAPLTALADMETFVVPQDMIVQLIHGRMLDLSQLRRLDTRPRRASMSALRAAKDMREVALVDEGGNLLAIGELRADRQAVHPRKVFVQA